MPFKISFIPFYHLSEAGARITLSHQAVHYDKETDSTITWIGQIKNTLKGISSEADKTFKILSQLDDINYQRLQKNNFKDFIKENELADKSLIRFLKDTSIKSKSLERYQQYLKDTVKATSALSAFTQKAGPVLKSFGAALSSMAINWAIGQITSFAVKTFDNLHTTLAEQQEITHNLQGELSEIQSDISGVNSELQTTANRIDELNAKGSLSFVEQEELDNLIIQNKELERRNKLLAEQEAGKQQEVAESVKKEFDKKYLRQTYSRIFLQQEIDEENAKRARYNELYSNEGHNTSEEVAEMRQLRLELDELNSADPTASFPEHVQQTIAAYEELNQRKKSGTELTKEEEDRLSKYRDELINTAVDLDDYSDRYGIYDETSQSWNNLLDSMYECLYPAEYLTEKFDEVFNSLSENVQAELKEAARNGSLSVENLSDNIIDKFSATGLSATEIIEQICSKLEDIDNSSVSNDSITLFTKLINSADSLDKFRSSVKSASDAYATLLSGNYSSAELLESIQAINQAASDMGSSLDWDITGTDPGSLKLLGDEIERISQEYAESILSKAGIETGSDFGQILTDIISQMYEAEAEFTGMNAQLDNLQSSYQTLTDILDSYNETGYLSLDNLQSLLTADENLISMLEVENGQLVINQEAYENLAAIQLLEFKEKLNNAAAAEIEALALNKAEEAVSSNAQASEDAVTKLDAETEAFNRNTSAAIANAMQKAKKDGISDEEIQNVLDKYTEIWNAAMDNYSTDFPAFMNNTTSSAGSAGETAGRSAAKSFTEALDKELAALDKNLNAGYIVFNDYIQARLALIEDYYDQGKLSADEYYSYLEKHYDTQLSYMNQVVNAVTRRIDTELDALRQQKEDVENIYKVQINSLEKQKTLLEEANRERQRQKDLQKSLYDMERARNQRTQMVYTEGRGMHYAADDQAIREAQENVDNGRYDMQIAEIEKSVSELEAARDRETGIIDEKISDLEAYRNAWSDVSSAYMEEQENLIAAQILGADWETEILNGRLGILDAFKNQYIGIQQAMADAAWQSANEQMKAAKEAEKGASGSQSDAPKIGRDEKTPPADDDPQTSGTSGRGSGNSYALLGGNRITSKINLKAYASGTQHAEKGLNLVGEDGAEAYFDNHGHVAIVTEPTLIPMEGGEVVKNERDTKMLLDPDNLVPADAIGFDNTAGREIEHLRKLNAETITLSDGTVLTPVQPGGKMYDMMRRFNTYWGNKNADKFAPDFMFEHNKQMLENSNQITGNNSMVNHNRNMQPVITQNITLTCPNVTNNSGVEYIQKELGHLSQMALQESMKR